MKYTAAYNELRDAKIAFQLQRVTFPAMVGLAILVAFGASRTHFFDRIRLCENGDCGQKQPGVSGRRPDIEQATLAWYDQAKSAWDNDPTHQSGSPVPLLIAATAGGGIRAAYWTATVLETLREKLAKSDEEERLHHYLFAISSVSGGSLGAAAYTATLPSPSPNLTTPIAAFEKPTKYLEADFLAPALASMLFHDTFSNVIPFLPGPDRGVALEKAFEEASDDKLARPFLSFFPPVEEFRYVDGPKDGDTAKQRLAWAAKDEWRPILLLNATHQKTGRRIIQSHILVNKDVFADAYDAIDLFHSDTPMSTAVMDSARFLYISPPGLMPEGPGGYNRGYIIDGGYYENFGAQTALELEETVERVLADHHLREAVKIVVLQISSDPSMRRTSRSRLIDDGVSCSVSTAGLHLRKNPLGFEDAPFNFWTLSSRGDDEGPGINFLNEVWSPLAGVMSTRESRGRAASEELATRMCSSRPGAFVHLAMCDPDRSDPPEKHIVPRSDGFSPPRAGIRSGAFSECAATPLRWTSSSTRCIQACNPT